MSCVVKFIMRSLNSVWLHICTGATRGGGANAISVHVVRKPQDGSADLAVGLLVAPSYVTYNKAAIEDIAGFFK